MVRLYSGAFVDVAMDYFLANDLRENSDEGWKNHSRKVYRVLNENLPYFPENFARMLSYMEKDDWLYNYRNDWGIEFSMKNVLRKARYLEETIPVYEAFLANKDVLKSYYNEFFPELKAHVSQVHQQLHFP